MDEPTPHIAEERDNLTRLLNLGRRKRPRINRRYSFVVRGLRLFLPLLALVIVSVVIAWPRMDEQMAAIPKEDLIPQTVGRNELINPHFESTTSNQQPYAITADRAVQSADNQSVVLLEQPKADVTTEGGEVFHAQSRDGTYEQDTEILLMDKDVVLKHSDGYTLTSDRMHVSMKDQTAWTDQPVSGDGPSSKIEAKAMNANNATGKIIFSGPAKLTIIESEKGLTP